MVYLVIRISDSTVFQVHHAHDDPTGRYGDAFEVKEWYGPVPPLHDPDGGVESYDPTLDDPAYPDFLQSRLDLAALAEQAAGEIEWLAETIPDIDTMTAAEVRDVVRRLAQENLRMIKAWRYAIRRFT